MSKTTSKKGIKMLLATADHITPEIGARVSAFLRQAFPRHTAKEIGRLTDADERTVKQWLAGEMPANKNMVKLAQLFGWRFISMVYEPACGDAKALRLAGTLDELESRAAMVKAEIDKARANFNSINSGLDC